MLRVGSRGSHWREPPYSEEEQQFLDLRLYRPPIAFMKGTGVRRSSGMSSGESYLRAHDKAIFQLGECIRGYIDAQDTSNWFMNFIPRSIGDAESLFVPMERALKPDEIVAVRSHAEQYGLLDLADAGAGVTLATFGGSVGTQALESALHEESLQAGLARIVPDSGEPYRIHVESGFHDFRDFWTCGVGSGATTRYLLTWADKAGEALREQFDQNPYIPPAALARMERDSEWARKMGPARVDSKMLAG